MSITGAPDAAGGEPTKVGVAISDVVSGMFGAVGILAALRRSGAGGRAGRRSRPAGRRVAARVDAGDPRQPGPERLRQRCRAGPARQRPPEHRARTRPSPRPTARSRSRPGPSASGRGSAPRSVCPTSPSDPRFATNGDRVERRAELRPILAARFAGRTTADWLSVLDAAEIPAGPINDVVGRLRVAGGRRARDDRRAGASGLGRDPPGRDPVHAGRDAGRHPDTAAHRSARTPTRSWPSSATAARRSPGCAPAGSSEGA